MQEHLGGDEDFGVGGRDVVAGIQRPERGHVAMIVIGAVHIGEPLLQLTLRADLIRRQLIADAGELLGEVGIGMQNFSGGDGVVQQRADNLIVHRGAGGEFALLGRIGRRSNEPAGLLILDQVIHEKERGLF